MTGSNDRGPGVQHSHYLRRVLGPTPTGLCSRRGASTHTRPRVSGRRTTVVLHLCVDRDKTLDCAWGRWNVFHQGDTCPCVRVRVYSTLFYSRTHNDRLSALKTGCVVDPHTVTWLTVFGGRERGTGRGGDYIYRWEVQKHLVITDRSSHESIHPRRP